MRISVVPMALILGLSLVSCYRDDTAARAREDSRAREAGRKAYQAAQDAKRDIKEAGRELQKATKAFREGWNEAKNQDKTHRDK
jgi:hypothetical protein